MIELRLQVDKYINFDKTLQVVNDLDLDDLGLIIEAKVDPTPSLTQTESSIGKRPTIGERDT